ncbi:MAG: alkaline phosphatase family protein [Bdellovibrionota bacterium]
MSYGRILSRKNSAKVLSVAALSLMLVQSSCGVTDSADWSFVGGNPTIPGGGNQQNPIPSDPSNPSTKRRRALVIGLDGTTGNQFYDATYLKNKARNLLELMLSGKYAACTQDTDPRCAKTHQGPRYQSGYQWKTGPGWASVLTGAQNFHHLIKNNSHHDLKIFSTSSLSYPTFLKRAKDHGLKTAAGGVATFVTARKGKSVEPGVLDYECGSGSHGPTVGVDDLQSCNLDARLSLNGEDQARDSKLSKWMEAKIQDSSSDIVMGVFDQIDSTGHAHGFDSNHAYISAIANADILVGNLINAVKVAISQRGEEWLVIVTSDHGGHRILFWGDHGDVVDEDEVIPFIVTTFGSERPLSDLIYPVTHMDVHPTLMHWFGIDATQTDGLVQGIR